MLPLAKLDKQIGQMRAAGAKCELRVQTSTVIFCNDAKSSNLTSYVAMVNKTSKLFGA